MKSSLQCFSRQQKGANIPDTYHLSIHVPKNENRPPKMKTFHKEIRLCKNDFYLFDKKGKEMQCNHNNLFFYSNQN